MELQSFTRTQHLLPWTYLACPYDFILSMMTHQKLGLFFYLNTVRKWALQIYSSNVESSITHGLHDFIFLQLIKTCDFYI